ncbi:hypothetical protein [Beijerinckia mobilis]|uniref:hypothetical protein n=1 Tax=Beijerinckia mobilis TaxID=231434 RepID=UPI0012EC0D0D|nr:hypothetical protein [Beijerinckia mobilis]
MPSEIFTGHNQVQGGSDKHCGIAYRTIIRKHYPIAHSLLYKLRFRHDGLTCSILPQQSQTLALLPFDVTEENVAQQTTGNNAPKSLMRHEVIDLYLLSHDSKTTDRGTKQRVP